MSSCRTCGADIIWVETPSGRSMPLDAQPTEIGNIEINGDSIRFVKRDRNATTPRYVSHFSTCPDAAKHRKKKRGTHGTV